MLSLLGWCERVLQRFPPELLNPADLLRGDFSIPQGSIQLRLKRLGDVLLNVVLLVLVLPLLGLACLLIWLTRIDELPQRWAVISGSMSLIGPRPERPEFETELELHIPHYRMRHWMRPGLSGWAQVNYPYGASVEDAANKLSYDLYYLRNFSFWLDLLTLFKTMRLVFNAQGAVPKV